MKGHIAKAAASELEADDKVERASVKRNDKGIYVEAVAKDALAKQELKSELHKFSVFIDVVVKDD